LLHAEVSQLGPVARTRQQQTIGLQQRYQSQLGTMLQYCFEVRGQGWFPARESDPANTPLVHPVEQTQ
jgi:hypothetical protein